MAGVGDQEVDPVCWRIWPAIYQSFHSHALGGGDVDDVGFDPRDAVHRGRVGDQSGSKYVRAKEQGCASVERGVGVNHHFKAWDGNPPERASWREQMSTGLSRRNCLRREVCIAWEKGDTKVAFQVMQQRVVVKEGKESK